MNAEISGNTAKRLPDRDTRRVLTREVRALHRPDIGRAQAGIQGLARRYKDSPYQRPHITGLMASHIGEWAQAQKSGSLDHAYFPLAIERLQTENPEDEGLMELAVRTLAAHSRAIKDDDEEKDELLAHLSDLVSPFFWQAAGNAVTGGKTDLLKDVLHVMPYFLFREKHWPYIKDVKSTFMFAENMDVQHMSGMVALMVGCQTLKTQVIQNEVVAEELGSANIPLILDYVSYSRLFRFGDENPPQKAQNYERGLNEVVRLAEITNLLSHIPEDSLQEEISSAGISSGKIRLVRQTAAEAHRLMGLHGMGLSDEVKMNINTVLAKIYNPLSDYAVAKIEKEGAENIAENELGEYEDILRQGYKCSVALLRFPYLIDLSDQTSQRSQRQVLTRLAIVTAHPGRIPAETTEDTEGLLASLFGSAKPLSVYEYKFALGYLQILSDKLEGRITAAGPEGVNYERMLSQSAVINGIIAEKREEYGGGHQAEEDFPVYLSRLAESYSRLASLKASVPGHTLSDVTAVLDKGINKVMKFARNYEIAGIKGVSDLLVARVELSHQDSVQHALPGERELLWERAILHDLNPQAKPKDLPTGYASGLRRFLQQQEHILLTGGGSDYEADTELRTLLSAVLIVLEENTLLEFPGRAIKVLYDLRGRLVESDFRGRSTLHAEILSIADTFLVGWKTKSLHSGSSGFREKSSLLDVIQAQRLELFRMLEEVVSGVPAMGEKPVSSGDNTSAGLSLSLTGNFNGDPDRSFLAPMVKRGENLFDLADKKAAVQIAENGRIRKVPLKTLIRNLGIPVNPDTYVQVVDSVLPVPVSESPYTTENSQIKFWLETWAENGPAIILVLKEGLPLNSSFIISGLGGGGLAICEYGSNGNSTLWDASTLAMMDEKERNKHGDLAGNWQVVIIPVSLKPKDAKKSPPPRTIPSKAHIPIAEPADGLRLSDFADPSVAISPPISLGFDLGSYRFSDIKMIWKQIPKTSSVYASHYSYKVPVGIRNTGISGERYDQFSGKLMRDNTRHIEVHRIQTAGITKDSIEEVIRELNAG